MKKILSLFLCILLLTGCAATYDGPTEGELVLTEYTVTHYPFGWEDAQYTDRSVYAYDIYGNRVREMEYTNEELQRVRNLKYDDRGNCIRETTWDHSGWFVLFDGRVETTYDEKNRLIGYELYDLWGRQTSGSRYTYDDEAGTRTWTGDDGGTQTAWLDGNGNVIREVAGEYETFYEYDENDLRASWVTYQNGQPFDSYQARYDDKGRQVWGGRYNARNELQSETSWEYDDEAHTCTAHRPNGRVRIEYFDAEGHLHRIEDYDTDGTLTMVQQYYYREIRVPADREE